MNTKKTQPRSIRTTRGVILVAMAVLIGLRAVFAEVSGDCTD